MPIIASEPPAPPAAVSAYERQIGKHLPEDFAAFLKRSNGGRIRPGGFDLPDGDETVINLFYKVAPGSDDDLGGYQSINAESLPSELVPIGEDPGGDLICLAVDGPHRGGVFYQAHDRDLDAPHPFDGFDNIVKVADSFDAFLSMLKD